MIKTTTTAMSAALDALLKYQGALLVQDPIGRQKYIRIIDRPWDEHAQGTALRQVVTVKYVEVASS